MNTVDQQLPVGWRTTGLGEIAQLRLGRTPARKETKYWKDGHHPWVAIADLNNGLIQSTKEAVTDLALNEVLQGRIAPAGTLLLSFKLTIGKVGILGMPAAHNEAIAAVLPDSTVADRAFLFFKLQTLDYDLYKDAYVKGATLSKAKLQVLPIALPPLSEQQAIAGVLRAVQTAKEVSEQVIGAAQEVKKSLMRHLFTYGPVPIAVAGDVELQTTDMGEAPADWSALSLGEAATLQRGFDITKKEQVPGPYPVVSSSGAQSQHIEWKVRGPGVVVGRKGSVGRVHYVESDFWPHDTTLWVKDFHGNRPDFIFYLLSQFEFSSFVTGVVNPSLNRNHVHPATVAIPSAATQEEVVSKVRGLERKIAAEEARRDALAALFNSLLHDLMTAQLRVTDLEVPA